MSDLLHTFLEHADRTCELPPAYWDTLHTSCTRQKALEAGLTAQQREQLEALLESESTLHTMDAEALFRRGLSIGLELSRLSYSSLTVTDTVATTSKPSLALTW